MLYIVNNKNIMINEQIKYFRKKAGFSQQKLANLADLSITAITNLEQGVAQQPTIQTMIKIADALNISIDELVGRKFKSSKK